MIDETKVKTFYSRVPESMNYNLKTNEMLESTIKQLKISPQSFQGTPGSQITYNIDFGNLFWNPSTAYLDIVVENTQPTGSNTEWLKLDGSAYSFFYQLLSYCQGVNYANITDYDTF